MKKTILAIICTVILSGCGVGAYSISSGKADEAAISFTASTRQPIAVVIDGTTYNVETVKTKQYKTDRKIKRTALNTITIQPGQHEVQVIVSGAEVYSRKLFISATEHKVVEL